MKRFARLIAFYLPQFHPIAENDMWWGKGFTEWTNTAKAKRMFRGHYQPHIPADLGFYDLRVPETRIAQAEMAKEYGIEAFCYYHYWFGGKRLLEKPFEEVLTSGEPDFPFCLCWANETWSGIWHGAKNKILIEQTYPGYDDYQAHFDVLLRAFNDKRYVTVDGKPILVIYRPNKIPEVERVMNFFKEMAVKHGLKGLHLIGFSYDSSWNPQVHGFDASITMQRFPPLRPWVSRRRPIKWLVRQYQIIKGTPTIYSYKRISSELLEDEISNNGNYPCVIPNWDNTPRSGVNGLVLHGSTPELFRIHLKKAIRIAKDRLVEHRLIFLKSWNEWAEGNHLEPDLKFGRAYLEIIKEEIFEK